MKYNIKREIFTDRLLMKIAEKCDAKNIHCLRTNTEVAKYIKRDIDKTLQDIEKFIEERNMTDFLYTINILDKKEFAGTIALWNINYEEQYAELGFELLPQFHRKGIMSNAVKAILNLAFRDLNFKCIESHTHKENISSQRLLEKCGFTVLPNLIDEENPNNIVLRIYKKDER